MSSSVGDANLEMTKDDADSASDNSIKNEKKKKVHIFRFLVKLLFLFLLSFI